MSELWIIFQREMTELQNLASQLDNVAMTTDAATRGRCGPQHEALTERADVIQQRALERDETLSHHIDSWNQFNQQYNDVCVILDDVENSLPDSVDMSSEVPVLRQQVEKLKDAAEKLETEMRRVSDVIEQGQLLLLYIRSPEIESRVNSLTDRVQHLTDRTSTDLQR